MERLEVLKASESLLRVGPLSSFWELLSLTELKHYGNL